MKIKVDYTESSHWIFVKVIKPPKLVGHQALRNQDFIDHDYWDNSYRYYKQVTEKQIIDRYRDVTLNINGEGRAKVYKEDGTEVIEFDTKPLLGKKIPIQPMPGLIRKIPNDKNQENA